MKKILIIFSAIFLLATSCTDQLKEDLLQNEKDVQQATLPHYLLSGSITKLAKFYGDQGFSSDKHNAVMQYYQQLFSVKSQTWEEFASAPSNWNNEYDILKTIEGAIQIHEEAEQPVGAAALNILKVFITSYITDHFGDIPYSEALKGREGIFFPKFDEQKEVYESMLNDLETAANYLASSTEGFDQPAYDLLYGGDKDKWVRFANSLRLRLLVRSYDAFQKAGVDNGGKISAIVSSGKYFTGNSHNAAIQYEGTHQDNSFPMGDLKDQSGEDLSRRKVSVTLVNTLLNLDDPRMAYWVAPAKSPWTVSTEPVFDTITDPYGNDYFLSYWPTDSTENPSDYEGYPIDTYYVGCPNGSGGTANSTRYGEDGESGDYDNHRLSSFTNIFRENSHPMVKATLMQADEVQFLLAEASQRGWISGNTETYYKNGIQLNMERWGVADTLISAYMDEAQIQLGTADDLDQIATQKWLALFTVGVESYLDYRRTGKPQVVTDGHVQGTTRSFPLRWRYPVYERDNNAEQYDIAVARQGEDTQTTEMWLLK